MRVWGIAAVLVTGVGVLLVVRAPWKAKLVPFRTAPVELRTVEAVVEASGQLDVVTRTDVPAPERGGLIASMVQEGDAVQEGQPLARLDERATNITVRSARAALGSATSRVSAARAAMAGSVDALDRVLRLSARGLASDSDVTSAEATAAQASAAADVAESEREVAVEKLAGERLSHNLRVLSAPVSGIVLSAPQTIGSFVAPEGKPLFVIGSPIDHLRLDATVAEADIGHVRVGQHARFTVPAYPNRSFDAQLRSIDVEATRNGTSVRYRVQLDVANPDHSLRPGMTSTVDIEEGRTENALTVREAALRFEPDGASPAFARTRVFRLQPSGSLRAIDVTPGLSDGAYTEVHPKDPGALVPGEPIVVGRFVGTERTPRGPGISLGGGAR
jgi:HlyD family secretion protein